MRTVFAIALPLLLAGCPPDPDEPTRPEEARVCVTDTDCIPDGGDACGPIHACVDQRCEATPSRFVPCR